MISPEKKKEYLEQLDKLCNPEDKEKGFALFKKIFFEDTNGGKLYKYRSVNDYSIDCLVDGTLYCARPDQFNDPFDCKIGVSFKSMYEAKYSVELDFLSTIFEDFAHVILSEKTIEECEENEKTILNEWMSNKELVEFVKETWECDATAEEKVEAVKDHVVLVADMLQTICEHEDFKDSLGICNDMLPHLWENITPDGKLELVKGNSSISDFARANEIYDDVDETELMLLLNEKLCPENKEDTKSLRDELSKLEREIINKVYSLVRVVCLATDFTNRLMWSHYADSHKGFCVEYDFTDTVEKNEMLPLPITYSDKRPLIPYKAVLDKSPKYMTEATNELLEGFIIKDKAWEYENEWRLLRPSTEEFVNMPAVSAIYLGALISDENKRILMQIAEEKGIPVFQMVIDRGEYNLHAIPITKEEA